MLDALAVALMIVIGCTFFATDEACIDTLTRQRDHAHQHQQPGRARIYQQLLDNTPERG